MMPRYLGKFLRAFVVLALVRLAELILDGRCRDCALRLHALDHELGDHVHAARGRLPS